MAALSEVSICNLALIALGAETITSLTQANSANASLCNALYDQTRDNLLTDHVWNFAQERFTLATLSATPEWTDDDMTIMYQKPSDCLKINYVNIASAIFKIESDKILSDTEGLKIKYTKRVTDPMLFFPKFIEALVARLAAEMAYAVTSKSSVAKDLFDIYYKKKLPEAKFADSQQGTADSSKQDEWLISRLHGSSPLSGRSGMETWYPCY